MIIDSHQHVFWHGRNDVGLIADMDENHIDLAWLLTWEIPRDQDTPAFHKLLNPIHRRPDGTHAGIVLSDILLTRDRYPDRFIAGYCPDPMAGDAPGLFEAAYQVHNVRVCGEWKFRHPIDDPRCINLFRKAGQLKCPVVLHLDVPYLFNEQGLSDYQSSWYGGTIDNLQRTLDACPDTQFIGHAPGFWREITGDADQANTSYPRGKVTPGGKIPRLMRQYPNLFADISAGSGLNALKRDTDFAKGFVLEFADRLLFGRDYYGGEHQAFLATLDLPGQVRDQIMGGNAQRLVCLDENQAPATTRQLVQPA